MMRGLFAGFAVVAVFTALLSPWSTAAPKPQGEQPTVFQFDLTANQANGWTDDHQIVYDDPLGIAMVHVQTTALNADGLPIDDSGGIAINAGVFALGSDNVLRQAITSQWVTDVGPPPDLAAVGSFYTSVLVVPEAVHYRLHVLNYYDGTPFTGPASPAVTVHVTVTYR